MCDVKSRGWRKLMKDTQVTLVVAAYVGENMVKETSTW